MASPAPAKDPFELVQELLHQLYSAEYLYVRDEEIEQLKGPGRFFSSPEEWEALKTVLDAESKQRAIESSRKEFQTALRKKYIEEWVQKNVKGLKRYEGESLATRIEVYSTTDQMPRLEEYLMDVLTLGYTGAYKKEKRVNRGDGGYIGHAWEVLCGLFWVALSWSALSVCIGPFQTVVVALLVLIYQTIYNLFSAQAFHLVGHGIEVREQLKRIRQVLGKQLPYENKENDYRDEQAFYKDLNRGGIRYWIRMAFGFLVWAIAMWKLVAAIYL